MVGAWASESFPRVKRLLGREPERRALDSLLEALHSGESRALVLHGQPGMGKSVLLDYLAERASDCRVIAIAGIEAEMELPFAALHQLCAPMLDHLERLPTPQRQALETTFGISSGPVPDRLLVGLAFLGLLSEVAADRQLVYLVDDAQWLDRPSAQVVAFAARRLGAEGVGIVIATRTLSPDLAGLAELPVKGLTGEDARALLDSVLTVHVDEFVLDRLVSETQGNPLAVLELPRGLTATELAGGFAPQSAGELSGSIEESFRQRVERLPSQTQRLLLLAASEPLGDPLLLWRAAERLGIEVAAGRPAVDDGLVSFENRVRFRHPLVRSAIYRSATAEAKRASHAALAAVTDPTIDPERRAWHRAQATSGPDEEVADELERYAGRAQSRGGVAAAAAFLERATELSPEPKKRATRALAAGLAKAQAGASGPALELLAMAEAGPLEDVDRARVDLVRAQLAFATNRGRDAPPLLLNAARRLEKVDADLARATYLDALIAASMAGRSAEPEANIAAVARAARSAPRPAHAAGPSDLLLDGLVAKIVDGYAPALPTLKAALVADRTGMPPDKELRWLSLAYRSAMDIWEDEQALTLCARSVDLAREVGALSELSLAVNDRALLLLLSGDPNGAASATEEAYATAEALRSNSVAWGPMGVAAWQGREHEASALIEAATGISASRGEGSMIAGGEWAHAVLNNGLGRYELAFRAAQRAVEFSNSWVFGLANWALLELIEAAARTGTTSAVVDARRQLAEMAEASGTHWAVGSYARALALASDGDSAEKLHRESIEHFGRSKIKAQLGRAHLLFGEWLRRERRRSDARAELRIAVELLDANGMDAFAERGRRELRATGETSRKRRVDTRSQLTAQETQVARLARDGLTNPEIGERLYISARTVQYHLGKVFSKLGITSRSQLGDALD
jgi:DNA-binding CsgD family transcriptional regulator